MARKPARAVSGRKPPAAVETSESIAEQTERFLRSGKKIEVIASGVSGQSMVAKKVSTAGNSRKQ